MPTTWCRVPRELLLTSCNFVNMNVLKKLTGYRQSLDKPELRPKAVLLDVNGTLFPATAAAPAFREIGLDEGLIELWFTKVLRDAFAAQAAGLYRPFKDIGAYHLDVLLRKAGKDSRLTGVEAMSKLVQAWSSAALYPDIPEALRTLNNANIKVSVMTNGSADSVARPVLMAGGVMQLVKGPLLDINGPQAWKPFQSSYIYAVKQLGVSEDRVLMVASHPWDIAGAMQAGLRGVYVQRNPAEAWPDYLPAPDATVTSFAGVVELLGLTGPAALAPATAPAALPRPAGTSASAQ
eukprot:GHRR01004423.1.p1 GENE.GHRR01004423.1~~GHRR01004423.1.p1  ORF type:complete len:293 (+),score=106.72 GHRR01004423.1:569-1447(+)